MERQPLVIEWLKLAVVYNYNDKAIHAACIRLSAMVLCATDEDFVPEQHHLVATRVEPSEFASSGIQLMDNALIERLFTIQGAVIAFCITVLRFFELLENVPPARHSGSGYLRGCFPNIPEN